MSANFPKREELIGMSLNKLRSLVPYDPTDEEILQMVIDSKVVNIPLADKINRMDVPDIKTPEDEAKWQAIIDEREAKIKEQFYPKAPEVVLDEQIKEKEEELKVIEQSITEIAVEVSETTEETPKNEYWCSTCLSKGVRHKKGCPLAEK